VLDKVVKTISRHTMLAPGARVIAAVSGGPDSVCLLHVLLKLGSRLGVSVAGVAHFNHQLRGRDSEEDERFVAEMAAKAGLAFFQARVKAPLNGNLEQIARRARREFFAGLIRDGSADCVALGHTRDDQAETVLLRLMRGSGLAGLAGVLPVTAEGLVRPLLDVTRAEVVSFLADRGIAWREDSSNREERFARNRVRHHLLPQLAREWNPNIVEALARLADLAYEEERWWAAEIAGRSGAGTGVVELSAGTLAKTPRALARRLVRQAIGRARGHLRRIEFQHVEQVLELAGQSQGSGRLRLPDLDVVRSFDRMLLSRPLKLESLDSRPVTVPGEYPAPDGKSLISFVLVNRKRRGSGCAALKSELCWRTLPEDMELRTWKPGDRYRPVGQTTDRKITEMFQEARVPSWRRRTWPILSSGSKILWAREFGAAAEFAMVDTGRTLRIRDSVPLDESLAGESTP
jgi:tRNA(Ile)-lysidine synthase